MLVLDLLVLSLFFWSFRWAGKRPLRARKSFAFGIGYAMKNERPKFFGPMITSNRHFSLVIKTLSKGLLNMFLQMVQRVIYDVLTCFFMRM